MNIKIELKKALLNLIDPKKPLPLEPLPITFNIALNELVGAISNSYMGVGTPYNPIPIDNFVNIGTNAFSAIDQETEISISLNEHPKEKMDDHLPKIIGHKLICCKVKNVGRNFINKDKDFDKHWEEIFNYDIDNELVYSAPDGILYISPDKSGKCVISTKAKAKDNIVSYSILISLKMKINDEPARRFYFILDPLVKVTSNGGTIPPVES